MSIEEFESWSLTLGLAGLIGFMIFIVWNLGRESEAGKFGTFVLFFVLAFGMLGFIAKAVIQKILGL